MIYKFADFNIKYIKTYGAFRNMCTGYEISDGEPEVTFEVTYDDGMAELKLSKEPYLFTDGICASALRKLAEWLPNNNAFLLHSATFDVDGVGVAFAAHSGTGKTTHMNLWQQLLGDKMVVVNGDKPIVRFFDDEPNTPYAYGTPWNGKERLGCNMRTPLKHICFIERSKTNYVEKADKKQIVDRIFNQVYMPKDPMAVMNTMKLIDRLLNCCNLWIIHCNMEPKAAEIAYDTILNNKE